MSRVLPLVEEEGRGRISAQSKEGEGKKLEKKEGGKEEIL